MNLGGSGHVTSFALLGSDGGLARYRLVIQPWLAFLAHNQDSWVFQDQTVAFFFSSALGPIGWLIVGAAVFALLVVTLWIEKSKDNKVQEWLARCHFVNTRPKLNTLPSSSWRLPEVGHVNA